MNRRKAGCTGKQRYDSPQAASRHRDALKRRYGDTALHIYRCGSCRSWHVGHPR